MGVASRLDPNPDFGEIAQDAASGNPVIVSTPVHYYYVNDFDPSSGRLRVGKTGESRRGGGSWMTAQRIAELDGGINGALYVDSPRSPTPSVAAQSPAALEGDRPPSEFEPPSAVAPPLEGMTPEVSGPVTTPTAPTAPTNPLDRYRDWSAPAVPTFPIPEAIGRGIGAIGQLAGITNQIGEPQAEAARQGIAARTGVAPEDVERLQNVAQVALAGDVTAPRRFYHGTGSAFDRPEPGKFDPNGLFGPGYYLTSEPRVAESYAETRSMPPGWIPGRSMPNPASEAHIAAQTSGPNVRAVDVPAALNLLDADAPVTPDAFERVGQAMDTVLGGLGRHPLVREATDRGGLSGQEIYDIVRTSAANRALLAGNRGGIARAGADETQAVLTAAGYDGISYAGGKRMPLLDEAGQPIEHAATVIFPDALAKIRNAVSGTPGGIVAPGLGRLGAPRAANVAGAVAGGAAGYEASPETDTPLQRLERTLGGAVLGGTGVNVARGLARGGLRGAVRGLAGEGAASERLGVTPGEGGLLDAQGRPIRPAKGDVAPLLDQLGNVVKEVRIRAPTAAIPHPEFLQPEARMPTRSVGLLRQVFDRSRNVIGSMGEAGQDLAGRVHAWREGAETDAAAYLQRMPTVDKLGKSEFTNLVDVLEGNAKPTNPRVAASATEAKGVLDDVFSRAQNAGVDVAERIGNYFPHRYKDDIVSRLTDTKKRAEAIRHLMTTGQADTEAEAVDKLSRFATASRSRRHGSLEMERLANLPGYEKTKEALYGHVLSASRRINEVAQFGPGDAIKDRLITRMTAEGYEGDLANDLFKTIVGAKSYSQAAEDISRVARTWHTATRLGLSAIANATQSVNTASVTGVLKTLQAMPKAVWSPAEKEFAAKTGVTLDAIIKEVRESSGWSDRVPGLLMPGFNAVETFNRRVAAIAGRDFARDMAAQAARKSSQAARALKTLGLDVDAIVRRDGVLTPEEEITAARNIVERTQFRADPQDLPQWASHPIGKMAAQFKTFAMGQTAFVKRELIDEARRGNVLPIARFAILAPLAQAAATETRNVLSGRPSEEDPGMRALQYALGPLGIVGDVSRTLFGINSKYVPIERRTAQFVGSLAGPTAGTATEALGAGLNVLEGNLTPAARLALRQVLSPAAALANILTPTKPSRTPAAPTGRRPTRCGATSARTRGGDLPGRPVLPGGETERGEDEHDDADQDGADQVPWLPPDQQAIDPAHQGAAGTGPAAVRDEDQSAATQDQDEQRLRSEDIPHHERSVAPRRAASHAGGTRGRVAHHPAVRDPGPRAERHPRLRDRPDHRRRRARVHPRRRPRRRDERVLVGHAGQGTRAGRPDPGGIGLRQGDRRRPAGVDEGRGRRGQAGRQGAHLPHLPRRLAPAPGPRDRRVGHRRHQAAGPDRARGADPAHAAGWQPGVVQPGHR
jgi:hypothetical protein